MVARILIIASVACVFNFANGLSPPFPGFKPCKSDDDECMKQNTNDGIKTFVGGMPDYGIESSDPDNYKTVDCSTPNMKFILKNVTLTGLKNCKALKTKRDKANMKMLLVLQCDLKLEGYYEMKGKLLLFEAEGADKIHVELPKIIYTITCNYISKEGKDGKKHIRIKSFEHSYEMKEKATLIFEGLYPHNEVLRAATTQVVKDNPNAIIKELGTKMIEAVIKRIVENINKLLALLSIEEVSLD